MFLENIKSLTGSTSFRLAFGLSLLFSVSSIIFFSSVYIFFFHSLKDTDRALLTSKSKQYSIIYQEQGTIGLEKLFSANSNNEARFTVRLQNRIGETVFLRIADDLNEFDQNKIPGELKIHTSKIGWSYIDAINDEDQIEILSSPFEDGSMLLVGKSTSERQDFLERAIQVFSIASIFSLVIGGLGGYWFSRRALTPLRDLLHTTQSISKENLNERMKPSNSNDEFSELTKVFNSMLDRVQTLVGAMQASLDGIAHDIKTPMTRLKASADLALSKRTMGLEEARDALGECSENSAEVLSFLNSLLDLSEADAGVMKLNLEYFKLVELFNEILDLYEIVAEESGHKISLRVSNDLRMRADRSKIKQALANLLDNAIKYSPPNTHISLSAIDTKKSVLISIADEGPGISESDLSQIWNRLFRGESGRSKPGTGLGLSLVKAIATAHGGKAIVMSTPGSGTRFQIEIPRF